MTSIASKRWIFIMIILFSTLTSKAQLPRFSMHIAPGLFTGYKDAVSAGPGFELKAAKRISQSEQITFNLGYTRMRTVSKKLNNEYIYTSLIPFTLGYRKYWSNFYIEPKSGIGNMIGRFNIGGDLSRPNRLTFNFSAVAGLKFSACYLEAELLSGAIGIEKEGAWSDRKFFYSGIKAGFRIF
jgi:hypothetical protein